MRFFCFKTLLLDKIRRVRRRHAMLLPSQRYGVCNGPSNGPSQGCFCVPILSYLPLSSQPSTHQLISCLSSSLPTDFPLPHTDTRSDASHGLSAHPSHWLTWRCA